MNKRNTVVWLISVLCCAIMVFAHTGAQGQTSKKMIVFVRHAEKDLQNTTNDPPLTAKGKKRAEDLVAVVEMYLAREQAEAVKSIVATEFVRTQQTAEPLAKKLNLQPVIIPASDKALLLTTIKESASSMLVVGHSNTLPSIIQQLTGETIPEIQDKEYNKIFILTIEGRKKTLAMETFGSR